ncbi:hypothetical protein PO909_020375 [Leuciscus waleckii]
MNAGHWAGTQTGKKLVLTAGHWAGTQTGSGLVMNAGHWAGTQTGKKLVLTAGHWAGTQTSKRLVLKAGHWAGTKTGKRLVLTAGHWAGTKTEASADGRPLGRDTDWLEASADGRPLGRDTDCVQIEPMSKGSSHQQLEEDVENEEQREKFEFEDDIGKQKGKIASGDETSGKCSELKTHSSKLNDTQEKHADPSQAITTVSPAGQECTSSHITNLSTTNKR